MTEDEFKTAEAELHEFNTRPSLLTEEDRLKIAKECGPPGYDPQAFLDSIIDQQTAAQAAPGQPIPEDQEPEDPGTEGGAP